MSDAMPPRRRERMFNMPGVVIACCVVLVGIYADYSFASDETKNTIIANFAFVPARVAIALDLARGQLRTSVQTIPQDTFAALIGAGGGRWWTLVTYAFLHGSWAHVGFNCLYLVAFGAPVARRFKSARFLLLLLVAAVAGAIVQFLWSMASFMPVIGASAAVAGAMGAAMRFVFQPARDKVETLDQRRPEAAARQPALSLRETLATRTALFFILFWFAANLVFGLFPALGGVDDGPIAWQAHIGGFLTGLLLFPLFDPKPASDAALPDATPMDGDEIKGRSEPG